MSVFLLITSTTFIIYALVLNENGIMGSLREAKYYEDAYEQLRYTIGDRLMPTGLPNSIIDDAFTIDVVYADLNDYVTSMFANDLPDIQRDSIEEIVNYNIDYFLLTEVNLSRTEVGYEVIDDIVEVIIDHYNDYVSPFFISYIARVSNVLENHLQLLIATGLIGMLVTMGILYLVNRHFKDLIFRYLAFSFGAAALMMIILPLILRIWGGYRRLMITPEFAFNFTVTHIERTISLFLLVGVTFIAFNLILISISARLNKKLSQV